MAKKERNIKAVFGLWLVVGIYQLVGGLGMYITNLFASEKTLTYLEYGKAKIGFGFVSLVLLVMMFVSVFKEDI